jgi:hypothetical protein
MSNFEGYHSSHNTGYYIRYIGAYHSAHNIGYYVSYRDGYHSGHAHNMGCIDPTPHAHKTCFLTPLSMCRTLAL